MNVHLLGLTLAALSPPVALTTAEPAIDPLVTCCTLDGFCQELTELECEAVSVVSLASDIEPLSSLKPSATFQIDGDAVFAVLANPDSFEARVHSCDERFLRSQDQGHAFNCLLDLDGVLFPVMWPDFDHRPERGADGFSSPQVGGTYFVRLDERYDDLVVFAALGLSS